MGYKDDSKMPLIGEKDDNSGAYLDLFSKAADKIGYKLKVERISKKRLYAMIEKGEIDFYPGASFSEDRVPYMCFLKNGMKTKEVVLTKKGVPEIKDFSKVSGTLLADLGGSKTKFGEKYKGIKVYEAASLNFEQAINLLKADRANFYIADIEEVDYYKKLKGLKSYEDIGITVHNNPFGNLMPMYMGFSMYSKLFKIEDNSKYDKSKPMDYENTPKTASKDCIAYKFYEALMQLEKSGETKKIYNKHFK